MLIRHVQRTAFVAGAVLAALLFFLGGAALRLAMGPISLGPFTGAIEDSLNRSIDGVVVRFDRAVLEWSRADGKINLVVLGTKVFDAGGHIIAQAPKASLDFGATEMATGHLSLKRFALIGVQLTGVRSKDGIIRLGFGPNQGGTDLFETIRRILRKSAQTGGSLESFSIREARLAFHDEPSGLFVVSPDASFTLQNAGDHFNASLDSGLEISGVPAHISVHALLGDDGRPQSGTVDVRGLSLAALAANSAEFSGLKAYRLTSNLSGSFAFAPNGDISTVSFRMDGNGTIDGTAFDAPLVLDKVKMAGRYDGAASRLQLNLADIEGKQASGEGTAVLDLGWQRGTLATISAEIDVKNLKFDIPGRLHQPVQLGKVSLNAAYDRQHDQLTWQRLLVAGGAFSADLAGVADFSGDGSPAIKLSGTLAALSIRDLLKYWPKNVADGAYAWIDANVPAGRIGPVKIAADLSAGALDRDALPEDALNISFPYAGLTARYFAGLTPITGGHGAAQLSGDSFRVTADSGSVGPLVIGSADIRITSLRLPVALADVKAHVEGKMSDVLALIDEDPLGYARRFGISPATAIGQAAVNLDFNFPLLENLPLEKVRFGVEAKVAELGVPIDQRRQIEHGMVNFVINGESLMAQGTGNVSGVPVNFKWNEVFDAPDVTTRIDVSGKLDDQARANLGLSEPVWLTGIMPATLNLTGRRFHFTEGAVRADLTNAVVDIPVLNIEKHAGVAMAGSAELHFGDKGALSVTDISVSGKGLDAHGLLSLDADGNLMNASFPDLRAGANNDFALNIGAIPGGGLAYRIAGRSLDATRLFGDDKKNAKAAGAPNPDADPTLHPLSIDASLDKAVFPHDTAFSKVSLALSFGANQRMTGFSLDAVSPAKGKVTGNFDIVKGARELNLNADDAGSFIRTFTDFTSLRDGTLAIHVSFPADQAVSAPKNVKVIPYDYMGTVTLSNFVVADQPFVARLLAAVSFDGGLRLLKGEGISITKLTAPFSMRGKVVNISDGRASGNAIGATFDGILDRRNEHIDLTGTLVPAFGINSVLGAVPLLGDILVSKQGEGIFGFTYALKGNLDEPSLSVNPLSFLTPGIFRRIFEFTPAKQPAADAQPQAAVTSPAPPPAIMSAPVTIPAPNAEPAPVLSPPAMPN